MSHYSPESWADYVRGLIGPSEARAMGAHLAGGCEPCGRAAAASETLQRLAATDRGLAVPAGDIRIVKAFFCLDHPRAAPVSSALRLIFDSGLAPAAGMRSSGQAEERTMVFESEAASVNLQLNGGGGSVDLAGGLSRPGGGLVAGVPVALLCRDDLKGQTRTDKEGDFLLADVQAADLTLRLLLDDHELLEAELP